MRRYWLPATGRLSFGSKQVLGELKGPVHNCVCEAAGNTCYNSIKSGYHH